MEDRKLDAAESLALIGRMIENTRSRMVRNAGRPFLAWGYATAATLIAPYGPQCPAPETYAGTTFGSCYPSWAAR